jgi:hypothetical protein
VPGNANSTPMQGEFWPDTGPTSDDMTTCEPSHRMWPTCKASDSERGGRGELLHMAKGAMTPRGPLTSSPGGFPVKTSATPARGPDSLENEADSGTSSPVLFACFDPATCSWKTSQLSLLGGWMPFSGRWPRTGTMRNGRAFRLPPLVPRISGIGSSSLPTPTAAGFEVKDVARLKERRAECKARHKNGNGFGLTLGQHVVVYPTPSSTDWNGSSSVGQRRGQISETIEPAANQASGPETPRATLNPAWVEWLQGFPPGWTEV